MSKARQQTSARRTKRIILGLQKGNPRSTKQGTGNGGSKTNKAERVSASNITIASPRKQKKSILQALKMAIRRKRIKTIVID